MIVRFVVWSPRATACMTCATHDKAERLMDFWRSTRLLGCDDWRVARVTDEPAVAAAPPRPGARGRSRLAQAANDAAAEQGDDPVRLLASKLVAQEALIAELRRRLNDRVLLSVRDAAGHQRRIGELEAQLAALRRARAKGTDQATG